MPTVHRERGFRFFFWSDERNEPPHVHVQSADGYAKVWLSPVSMEKSVGFDSSEVNDVLAIVTTHRDKMEKAWHDYFRP